MASATSTAIQPLPIGRYDSLWRTLAFALNGAIVVLPYCLLMWRGTFTISLIVLVGSSMVAISSFAVVVIALNRWRLSRGPLLALVIPVVLMIAFLVPGLRAISDVADFFRFFVPFLVQILVLAVVLRLLGFRLYTSATDRAKQPRWRYSLRSLLVITIFVAVYTAVIGDLFAKGAIHQAIEQSLGLQGAPGPDPVLYVLFLMQVSVLAVMMSLIGWWTCVATAAIGLAFATPAFYYRPAMTLWNDPVLQAYWIGCTLVCAAIIALPWLGLGWRVRWDKPVWEREFNPAVVS